MMTEAPAAFAILGLTGAPGSGKTMCADILQEHFSNIYRAYFADPLLDELVAAFGVDIATFIDHEQRDHAMESLAVHRCANMDFIDKMRRLGKNLYVKRTPADLMQLWGVEFRLEQNSSYWLEHARAAINDAINLGFKRILFADVRFSNEAWFIRNLGGKIWWIHGLRQVTAKDTVLAQTSSKAGFPIDRIIANNGSVTDFAEQVISAWRQKFAACCP